MDTTDIIALYTPYLAAIEGRDAASQQKFFERFAQQPREIRLFIASEETANEISRLVISGVIPAQFAVAVAKLIALLAVEEIQSAQIGMLLEKLGLQREQASTIDRAISVLMKPVVEARAKGALPTQLPELPPLTTAIPPAPAASTQPAARNIIDLRKQQSEQ